MKTLLLSAPLALVLGLCATSQAQVVNSCSNAVAINLACPGVDHVVCIDNFSYTPARIAVQPGQTVAWVNVERGCNTPPGSLFGSDCDARHTVTSDVVGPDGDKLDSCGGGTTAARCFLCSPNAPTGNNGKCNRLDLNRGSNVFCHTYANASTLHYSCTTNPVHTLLMHGSVE